MWPLWSILIYLTPFYGVIQGEQDIRINCPLKWVSFDTGYNTGQVPSSAISTSTENNYVVKITSNSTGNVYIGQLSTDNEMAAYAAISSFGDYEAKQFDSFELLTNPHGCRTQWMNPYHQDVAKFSTSPKVCRSETDRISGHFEPGFLGNCVVAPDSVTVHRTRQFSILVSYRPGVMTKVVNFSLAIDPNSEDGELDFIGLDELTNHADVTVIQVVTHTKKVSERISYTETTESSSVVSVTHGFGLFLEEFGYGANINFEKGEGESSGTTETLSNSTERIVEVSREVVVPSYTSLTVCSTIAFNDKYNSSYSATAQFSSPGLSALQVQNHLVNLGMEGPFIRTGEMVSKIIKGTIAATLAMETHFIVTPQNSFRGCETLMEETMRATSLKIQQKSGRIMKRVKAHSS